ncbi:hypothetical protein D9M71_728830 [compost metagenome]
MLPGVLQADGSDGVVDARLAFLRAQVRLTSEVQAKGDVFLQRQPGQQTRVLKRDRHPRMRTAQRLAKQADTTAIRLLQTGQHPQQAGFADTAGA